MDVYLRHKQMSLSFKVLIVLDTPDPMPATLNVASCSIREQLIPTHARQNVHSFR